MDDGAIAARPHLFTVADYHRMAAAGILNEDSRVELIRGQIVDMAPIGAPHLNVVNRLTRLLPAILGTAALYLCRIRFDWTTAPNRSRTSLS